MLKFKKENMTTPQLLKGFRDFLPTQKRARDSVMRRIVSTFETFGFDPIETPTLEYKETIMGKYGAEADKLVYQFTDNGDRAVAMRYDQTVPTARFIANNFNELSFPFRRYQTQNVFRAEKPQRGRYREFTQCDIDIFGSTDVIADAEILACTYAAYKAIGFQSVQLSLNDRETLVSALTPFATDQANVFSIIQSIDKLDKLPADAVKDELMAKGFSDVVATSVLQTLDQLEPSYRLEQIMSLAKSLGVDESALQFVPSLARGLDYYTGMIFEIRIPEFTAGSLGGGGRYDNLIQQLGGIAMPAVGMAVGFDRTVDAALQLGLIAESADVPRIVVTIFDEALAGESAIVVSQLRAQGLMAELYPKFAPLGKQFKYADKKDMRYAVVIGSDEVAQNKVVLKDLQTGEQQTIPVSQIASLFVST